MPTPNASIRPKIGIAARQPVHPGESSKRASAPTISVSEARFAAGAEDISSLLTFIPVGLLALVTFGAMLTSR
jgi:hypothetical protein